MTDTLTELASYGVVPVVTLDDPTHAAMLADALAAGGLPSAEVTLRTPNALGALRELAQDSRMLVGAGTVVNAAQVEQAVAAGAKYIVSPGFLPSVSAACAAFGVPLIPGTVTATEIMAAMDAGHTVVKFFPAAASGGIPVLKALSAPFSVVRFVPTGGIDATSLADYLRLESVLAVGGTWIAPRDLIAAGDSAEITARAKAAVDIVKEAS